MFYLRCCCPGDTDWLLFLLWTKKSRRLLGEEPRLGDISILEPRLRDVSILELHLGDISILELHLGGISNLELYCGL